MAETSLAIGDYIAVLNNLDGEETLFILNILSSNFSP